MLAYIIKGLLEGLRHLDEDVEYMVENWKLTVFAALLLDNIASLVTQDTDLFMSILSRLAQTN